MTAGTDLTGGGATGSVTLNLDTTKVPLLATANTFNAGQTVQGNVTLSGARSGVIFADGTKQTTAAKGGGSGTVTSVAMTAPSSDFTVTGSPITTAGTLGLGWTVAPTNASTPNAIVKRDGSGNFSANSLSTNAMSTNTLNATIPLFGGNGPAVSASSVASAGVAVSAVGGLVGVYGSTIGAGGSANGVQGASTNATAVRGDDAGSGSGVVGTSTTGYGVYGSTGGVGAAVGGYNTNGPGGFFFSHGPNGALIVQSETSSISNSVMEADSIFGGVTTPVLVLDNGGNLSISGNISKAGGSFNRRLGYPAFHPPLFPQRMDIDFMDDAKFSPVECWRKFPSRSFNRRWARCTCS